jgi:phosphate transport system permease protein
MGAFPFVVRYTADLLNGVPSIVMGLFAYSIVVRPMHQFSALAGGVALSVILIPTTIRTTEQFLRAVPQTLREGALALGASKWKAIVTVVVPAAMRGVATGMILGVARIAGESAPLLFTSFGNQYWSSSLGQPTASLPVMIFTYAISPYADWHREAWAAGLVLLAVMLLLNISARLVLSPGVPRH